MLNDGNRNIAGKSQVWPVSKFPHSAIDVQYAILMIAYKADLTFIILRNPQLQDENASKTIAHFLTNSAMVLMQPNAALET